MLFAKEVAERRGITLNGARRYLRKLESEYGTKVVGRIGNRRYITADSISLTGPNWVDKWKIRCDEIETSANAEIDELKKMCHKLANRVDELNVRLDSLSLRRA